jgi:SAM-dependent methyltransferase
LICRVCSIPLSPWSATAGIPLSKCGRCGSIHAECEKPSEDLYADLYSKDEIVPAVVATSLDAVVQSMASFRTHGKWLDVGFGQGALLDAAARAGWECHGTELSKVALEKGRARGFITAPGTEDYEDGAFDVVSLVELVEHVENPAGFLSEGRRVLRRGGCLYVTTPNAWSLNRWCLGAAWTVFGPPDHITIFTPSGLQKLLRGAGFERVALRAEGLNPFEILQARGNRGPSQDFNRVEEGTKLCTSLSTSPARRGIKRAANIVLSALRIGDGLKARAI